jgi:peptidoglycan/LPS O-acetylase OafA/YrhL
MFAIAYKVNYMEIIKLRAFPNAMWSIKMELQYYAYIPIVVMAYIYATRGKNLLIRLILGFLFILNALSIYVSSLRPVSMVSGDKYNGSNAYINLYPVFLGGSLVGLLQFELERHQESLKEIRGIIRLTRILDILSIVLPALTLIFDNPHFHLLRSYTGHNFEHDGVLLGLGILSNIHAKTPLLSKIYDTGLLRFFGRISFGIYLLHQPGMALVRDI